MANLYKKVLFTLLRHPSFDSIKDRLANASKVKNIRKAMTGIFRGKIYNIEHHRAHLASAFFVSPFNKAAVLSIDGFGDFASTMLAVGEGSKIKVISRVNFPHSLGLFYTAFTQYLGFPGYGDEYKLMGLSSYGEPTYLKDMEKIVRLGSNGNFELNLDYFVHHSEGVQMLWEGGKPTLGTMYSKKIIEKFGPARKYDEPITQHHQDIAASLQAMYEKALFHVLNHLYKKAGTENLCLAGGCAQNSVANGKILDCTLFREIYIPPAASDAGGALGAAYYLYHQILNNPRTFVMDKPYWGLEFDDTEIGKRLKTNNEKLSRCRIKKTNSKNDLCNRIAKYVADGMVVGWFQGRMEYGPRALGNRSILADPRKAEMKDILNMRIKRREPFRPFAPSILLELVGEYFEKNYPDPFMLKVYPIKAEKHSAIPAVTHVDGTGRLQTVSQEANPLYWKLLDEFRKLTSIPVILNTSFNENEPIVCTPEEALDCFLRTKMDVLVLGSYIVLKT